MKIKQLKRRDKNLKKTKLRLKKFREQKKNLFDDFHQL